MTEDSSLSGWAMSYPTGRRLDDGRRGDIVGSYDDDGNWVTDERLAAARDAWTEARAEDFEHIGKRAWRDKASGKQYRQIRGTPFPGMGSSGGDVVDLFFTDRGRFVFLAGEPERVQTAHLGRVSGERAKGTERTASYGPQIL